MLATCNNNSFMMTNLAMHGIGPQFYFRTIPTFIYSAISPYDILGQYIILYTCFYLI